MNEFSGKTKEQYLYELNTFGECNVEDFIHRLKVARITKIEYAISPVLVFVCIGLDNIYNYFEKRGIKKTELKNTVFMDKLFFYQDKTLSNSNISCEESLNCYLHYLEFLEKYLDLLIKYAKLGISVNPFIKLCNLKKHIENTKKKLNSPIQVETLCDDTDKEEDPIFSIFHDSSDIRIKKVKEGNKNTKN